MKKWIVVLTLIVSVHICGCHYAGNVSTGTDVNGLESEIEMDANNRTIMAEALGVEEDSRTIEFLLSTLRTINAGQIQSAEAAESDGEKVLHLVAEDDTKFQIYLSKNGGVEAVENVSTGEWPVRSER